LNIQDDGSYTYDCPSGGAFICKATSTIPTLTLTVTLNQPIQLGAAGAGGLNPICNTSGSASSSWCPA
jgi:hypothetical protein